MTLVAAVVDRLSEAGVERGISALEARNYATQHGARYHETSAVSGKGIGELFRDVATHYAEQRRGTRPPGTSHSLFLFTLVRVFIAFGSFSFT